MVLVRVTPYFPVETRADTPDNRSEANWQRMRQWHKHGDEQIRKIWQQMNALKDSYDDMNFTPPYLSTITARTLIVQGDRDPLYPVKLALELYTAIPRAYLWVVPNGGHGPLFGPLTEPFVETALAFLRSEWTGQWSFRNQTFCTEVRSPDRCCVCAPWLRASVANSVVPSLLALI